MGGIRSIVSVLLFYAQPHAEEAAAGRRMGRAAGAGRMEWIMDV